MRLLIFIAIVSLLVITVISNISSARVFSFPSCGENRDPTASDIPKISTFDISPNPAEPGQDVTITVTASSACKITDIHIFASDGNPWYRKNCLEDTCSYPIHTSYSKAGTYTIHTQAYSGRIGIPWTCLTGDASNPPTTSEMTECSELCTGRGFQFGKLEESTFCGNDFKCACYKDGQTKKTVTVGSVQKVCTTDGDCGLQAGTNFPGKCRSPQGTGGTPHDYTCRYDPCSRPAQCPTNFCCASTTAGGPGGSLDGQCSPVGTLSPDNKLLCVSG